MPELPEVETIRSQLAPRLVGQRISGVEIADPLLVAPGDADAFAAALVGRRDRHDRTPRQVPAASSSTPVRYWPCTCG